MADVPLPWAQAETHNAPPLPRPPAHASASSRRPRPAARRTRMRQYAAPASPPREPKEPKEPKEPPGRPSTPTSCSSRPSAASDADTRTFRSLSFGRTRNASQSSTNSGAMMARERSAASASESPERGSNFVRRCRSFDRDTATRAASVGKALVAASEAVASGVRRRASSFSRYSQGTRRQEFEKPPPPPPRVSAGEIRSIPREVPWAALTDPLPPPPPDLWSEQKDTSAEIVQRSCCEDEKQTLPKPPKPPPPMATPPHVVLAAEARLEDNGARERSRPNCDCVTVQVCSSTPRIAVTKAEVANALRVMLRAQHDQCVLQQAVEEQGITPELHSALIALNQAYEAAGGQMLK